MGYYEWSIGIYRYLTNWRVGMLILAFAAVIWVVSHASKREKKEECTGVQLGKKKKAHGMIFGIHKKDVCYSPTGEEGHCLVLASTGKGKTSAILIPTLRAWSNGKDNATFFCIDISGDINSNVSSEKKLVYNPDNPNTTPYNVFAEIDSITDEDERNEKIVALALLIMPEEIGVSDSAKYFSVEGRKILVAALIAFGREMDFCPICEKIVTSSWKNLFNDIDATGNPNAIKWINSFQGCSEQNTSGAYQQLCEKINLFGTSKKLQKTIHRPVNGEIAFEPKMIEEYNCFIVIDDSKLEQMSDLLHIVTAQSLAYFSTRQNNTSHKILFCLDELASMGKLELLPCLRKYRKKGIRLLCLTQSLADLRIVYGENETEAMLANFAFTCLLGINERSTQEYYSNVIGYKNVQKRSVSISKQQMTRTVSETKELRIEPAELGRLGDELLLLHENGCLRLKKNFYYKN